ncbi:PAS domain S-box protein [Massilia sp. TWP1-3-3]|uniref:hybrid sensor histidine kinase/response regulator n=1 Tax=Massilia sp. TWP1-3-3 TaxID=2804573 RepID=UPI003CF80810
MIKSPASTPPPATSDRFQQLVASVTDYAIYMLSPEGVINTWNAGAQRFKGYTPEEIIGQHFSRFYTPDDLATNLPARALATARNEGRFEDEGWRVRKDGTRFWASVVIDPVRAQDGELIGFAKVTRDITERKRASEALHASEERFRLLVQGVTDYAIYMLSPKGEITNWNAGARRIKGFDDNEVIGSHFSRFYTPEDRAHGLPMIALATAVKDGRFESEGWRMRKSGERFWAHVVIDPIHNELGELIGFAKVTRDITERRDAAITIEKASEALFQSQKLEAIGKLTGGVAHDFNNLLSVISNGLTVLKTRLTDPADWRVLEAMDRAASRGATLTQQLLTFARQQPLKQDNYDLNEVIASFEAVLRRAVRGSVGFDLQLGADLPLVLVDAPQVEAAILNLIVNARDATPDGGRITVSTRVTALRELQVGNLPAGSYVTIRVDDTGEGMSADVISHAVEPFFTTKPIGKGTGLGLSHVYGLMHQSGGDLAITSTPGAGTSVALYFPALAADAEESSGDTGREKALVVDDQIDVLDMAVELFRTLGYDVLSANNGAEALAILQRTSGIDVLFSDVVMPGMSGIELGAQARRLYPDMKIILASGYATAALKELDGEAPQFPIITKPYSMAQILRQLR